MLITPFGSIHIKIDDLETEYIAVKLPLGGHGYSGAAARYAIRIDVKPDGYKHNIDCRLSDIPQFVEGRPESGEDLECMTFSNSDGTTDLTIACLGETWEMGCSIESLERGYDYDAVTLQDGMRYTVMPATRTSEYIFGICWKEGITDPQDLDTWFGADPNLFGFYCIDPAIGTITYDILLELFRAGKHVDETNFYFEDDPDEQEHFLGYLPEVSEEKPYWVGYCDIKDGCEFSTAEEMFEAKIFEGRSLRDRWDSVVLVNIGGISVSDYYYSVPEVRHLFTEGGKSSEDVYDIVLKHLNEHDVYGLLSIGAPADEYTEEAKMIADNISMADSVYTIASVISNVINRQFEESKVNVDYLDLAKDIRNELISKEIRTDKYFCTCCGASLDDQKGFDPEMNSWVCRKCGQQLTGNDLKSDLFGDVVWYCDQCGVVLNRQEGFTEEAGTWRCTGCGFENDVTADNIKDGSLFN